MEKLGNASKSETCIADENVFQKIWEELLQGAIWEFCFDVHRAAKLSYLFLDPALDLNVELENEKELEESEEAKNNSSDQKVKSKNYTYICPNCKKSFNDDAVGKHLLTCLGIKTRTTSRPTSRKIAASTDEIDDGNNSNSSLSKRKTKKSQRRRQSQKAKFHGSSSKMPLESINFENLTYEEIKQSFEQKCGVVTKTMEMCMNSFKCTQHTDEEKREIRHCILSDMSEQLIIDSQIDVDTVDEGNYEYLFS